MNNHHVIEQVKKGYGNAATEKTGLAHREIAKAFGYTDADLDSLPENTNLGLSCGNPIATAHLQEGEIVVDLGCGAGIDVLLAAPKVGPNGRAIGIDMTPEMVDRAKSNSAKANQGKGYPQVEFYLAPIDKIPLKSESADCLISNCVINLAPDKDKVFREMYRILKTGGRLAISDIALKKNLPDEVANNALAYLGCISGAIPIRDYQEGLTRAGFNKVQIIDTHKDLNSYALVDNQVGCCTPAMSTETSGLLAMAPEETSCCSPSKEQNIVLDGLRELIQKYDLNEFAASVQVFAIK